VQFNDLFHVGQSQAGSVWPGGEESFKTVFALILFFILCLLWFVFDKKEKENKNYLFNLL
jgi:hypothetical protein